MGDGDAVNGRKRIDRIGQRFGKWTIVAEAPTRKHTSYSGKILSTYQYRCRCDCGAIGVVQLSNLTQHRSAQCVRCGYDVLIKYRVGVVIGTRTLTRPLPYGRWAWRCACGARGACNVSALTKMTDDGCGSCRPRVQGLDHWRAHPVTANGETHSWTEWATLMGISRQALHIRIKNGWPLGEAVSTPKMRGVAL